MADAPAPHGISQPLVLTVHGINTDGEWQDVVENLLTPHCVFRHYRYSDYRYAGFLRQLLSPSFAFVLIALFSFSLSGVFGISQVAATEHRSQIARILRVSWPWDAWLSMGLVALAAWLLACASRPGLVMGLLAARLSRGAPWFRLPLVLIVAVVGLAMGPWLDVAPWAVVCAAAGVGSILIAGADCDPWLTRLSLVRRASAFAKSQLLPLGFALLAASAGLALAVTGPISPQQFSGAVWILIGVAVLILGYLAALRQRSRRVKDFLRFLNESDADKAGRPVHLIAHSFGTYLTGQALRKPNLSCRLDRIILVGSVLRRDYRWHRAGDRRRLLQNVNQVRNEVGGRDAIVSVIQWFESWGWKRLRFGSAGKVGHDRVAGAELVHDIENSLDFCEECVIHEELLQHRVHNVFLPTFRHSDALAVRERTIRFWLPYLLGLDSWEYWHFRQMCAKAATYEEKMNRVKREYDNLDDQIQERFDDLFVANSGGLAQDERDQIQTQIDRLLEQQQAAAEPLAKAQQALAWMEKQLAQSSWSWATMGGIHVSLDDWIVRKLFRIYVNSGTTRQEADTKSRTRSRRALRTMWGLVGEAVQMTQGHTAGQPLIPAEQALLLTLDPRVAVEEAVDRIA